MNQGESGAQGAVDTAESYVEEGAVQETPASPEPARAPAETETPAESPEENADGSETAKKRKRSGYVKKLDRKDAEIAALKAELAKVNPASPPVTASKPTPEQYPDDWNAYNEALIDWKADQKVSERLKEQEIQSRQLKANEIWENRKEKGREKYEDYDEVIAEYDDVPVRKDIIDALTESDIGEDVQYYLAKNPEELDKINRDGISSVRIGKEIARIEALIRGKQGKAAVKVTQAPPPLDHVKPSSSGAANTDPRGYIEL